MAWYPGISPDDDNYLQGDGSPVTAPPITISAWVYPFANIEQVLVFIGDKDTADHGFMLYHDDGSGRGRIAARVQGTGGAAAQSVFGSDMTTGAWNHGAAVFASATSRTGYQNGVAATTNTLNRVPATPDRIGIGKALDSTPSGQTAGVIAEVGIWSAALAASEILQLSKGYSPLLVRPSALVAYWPLVRDWAIPKAGELDLTVEGTDPGSTGDEVDVTHPRIVYPKHRQPFIVAATEEPPEPPEPPPPAGSTRGPGLRVAGLRP